MEKEVQSSLEYGTIRKLSVLADLANEDSTCIKQKISILDHPKNLIEVLRARLTIDQVLTDNITIREYKVLKARTKDKPNYSTKDYMRKSREVNLLVKEAVHQRAKYLKYKKLNKSSAKKKTRREETVIIDDTSDSDSYSSSEAHNYRDEDEKTSIAYNSESDNDDKIINSSIGSKGKN